MSRFARARTYNASRRRPIVTEVGGHTWRASSVDGAGFQQAVAVSDPSQGHAAGVAVAYSDIAGFHLSTDRGDTWTQANKGLVETWHKKGVAVQFDRHNANCVLAYFSNAEITGTAASADVGKKAGILYGVINVAAKSIEWTILIDQNITSGPTYPSGLYPAAGEGPNAGTARQTGKMLACDPFAADRWYVGTRQGVQIVTVNRTGGVPTGATVTNLARNTVDATTGARDSVTSIVISPESTSTNTVIYFTIRAGGINGGLNRRFACGPGQTGTTVLTRLAGTNSVTTTQGAEGVSVEMENGFAVAYVAANDWFRKWTQTTAGTTTGTWTVHDPLTLPTDLKLHTVSTARVGSATRVVTAHYSTDGAFPKIFWSENGGSTWGQVTKAKTSIKIAGGATDWWLVSYKPYYQPSELAGEGGWDGSQIALWPDDPKRAIVSGRSGLWKTNDITAAGANWHPAVKGLRATVANWCAPSPTTSNQVVFGDVDWATILSDDGATTKPPVLDETGLGSPTYGIDWYSNAYVRGQGDRDDPLVGGGIVHVANPFGTKVTTKLGGFGVDRVFGVALGETAAGIPVVLGAVENVGIQRREGAISTAAGTFTTASADAKPVLNQKYKCPILWPGDKPAGASGDYVYAYIAASSGTGAGIWRSSDRGVSWTQVIAFNNTHRYAAQIICDPVNLNRIYYTRDDGAAGTTGVYRVENAHNSWSPVRILTLTSPGPIAIDPRNGWLYAVAMPDDSGGGRLLYTTAPTTATPTWTRVVSSYLDQGLGAAHHMAFDKDGRGYIAAFDGGYLVGDPVGTTTPPVEEPTPVDLTVSDAPVGFTDRWGQSPSSAGVANSTYASVVKNAVAKVDWADLQPTNGAMPSLDIFTKDDTNGYSTVTLRQMIANVKAAGGKIRLRVMAGVYAPDWVKNLGGSPLPWFDDRTVAGGPTSGNSFTIGRWWRNDYQAEYADLQVKLASLLDAEPTIADVTIVGSMTVYSEPMIKQMSDPTSFTPNNRQTLLNTAGEAEPYSRDADVAACKKSIDAHKVWKQTRSSLAVNPYQYVVSITNAPSSDTATTLGLIDYTRNSLGDLSAFGNHSLRDNQQAYDDATGTGEGGNMQGYNNDLVGVVYPKMKAMRDLGSAVYFQTDVARRTGRLASATPTTLTNVTVNWNDGVGNRTILGGPACDLALHFGATDIELPRNYDPGSTVSATYPVAAKFTSISQANAYISSLNGSKPPTPPPATTTEVVSRTDVVRSVFHDGALPARESGSIYVANDHVPAISIKTRDWAKGAALHAAARPDQSPPYHGAPWDWTISGTTTTDYDVINIWHEVIPYRTTGIPRNVRVQYKNIEVWTIPGTSGSWTKRLGSGATGTLYGGGAAQTSSGRPDGGYFTNDPIYDNAISPSGAQCVIEGWPENPGAKWRAETAARGGGWSVALNPQSTTGGNVIDDMAILHGAFLNTTGNNRIPIPTGGYVCYSGWMRLIMEDYTPVPSTASWIGCFGSDIFGAASQTGSQRSTSMVNPRHIELTSEWKWSGYCSGSATMIRSTFPKMPFINSDAV